MGGYAVTMLQPYIHLDFINEINQIFDDLERDDKSNLLYLFGTDGMFCKGLDFKHIVSNHTEEMIEVITSQYCNLLDRISEYPKFVVAVATGKVMAGGVGIACACDYILVNDKTDFSLSEMLWEMLPAMVAPYLVRRIGLQKAHIMTLTMQHVNGSTAVAWNLADEESNKISDSIRRLCLRVNKVTVTSIQREKKFMKQLWMENTRIYPNLKGITSELLKDPVVFRNIRNYVCDGRFPWEME